MPGKEVLKWNNLRYFFVGDADEAREIGGEINSFTVSQQANAVQFPNFGSDSVGRDGGIIDASIDFQGYTQAGDDWSKAGQHFYVMAPRAKSQQGEVVILGDVVGGAFDMGAIVGEAQTFTLNGPANGILARGKVLRNAYKNSSDADASDSAAATGAEVQLSTVGTGQGLFAVVFLLNFTGTSISFSIESDATGFASPTARINLGTFTAPGAGFGSFRTPITPDDRYRVVTTGTFSNAAFVVAAAVGRL